MGLGCTCSVTNKRTNEHEGTAAQGTGHGARRGGGGGSIGRGVEEGRGGSGGAVEKGQ